ENVSSAFVWSPFSSLWADIHRFSSIRNLSKAAFCIVSDSLQTADHERNKTGVLGTNDNVMIASQTLGRFTANPSSEIADRDIHVQPFWRRWHMRRKPVKRRGG